MQGPRLPTPRCSRRSIVASVMPSSSEPIPASPPVRVSVVLCTHGGARFVREQIESVVRQTRQADEIVVRDDRSTDSPVAILREYLGAAPLPPTISTLGSTENFARAIADASGDIVALCDQDDKWEAAKLERLVAALGSHDDLVFTDAELDRRAGRLLGRRLWEAIEFRGAARRDFTREPLRILGRGKNVVTGATMAFRCELRKFLLPIPREWTHDGWIAIIAAVFGNLVTISDPLICYRIHARQQLGLTTPVTSLSRDLPALELQLRQYRAALERCPLCDGARRYCHHRGNGDPSRSAHGSATRTDHAYSHDRTRNRYRALLPLLARPAECSQGPHGSLTNVRPYES